MSKRKHKSTAKDSHAETKQESFDSCSTSYSTTADERKRLRVFMYEFGKFMVDIAKLVFAGVIIAGIMDEEIDRTLLFLLGSVVVVAFAFIGISIISINKEAK